MFYLKNGGDIKIMDENKEDIKDQSLVHDFNTANSKFAFSPKIALIFVVVILLGLGSGYVLSTKLGSGVITNNGGISNASISKGTTVGSNDTNTFKDTAQGTLKQGGIDGEGAFHLERPGGASQNVYLTSSTVDMTKFVDKKIKVWGQTQKAQHAGWLMDVGRVEVL